MADTSTLWTITELTDRVVVALEHEGGAALSGRVREVPDARTIRWYQTTGLVDRPEIRGRTARYGRRHLWQLVAIKRLQARGLPLSEIQAKLAGLSDAELARLADHDPEQSTTPTAATPAEPAQQRRFWTAAPAAAPREAPRPEPARRITVDALHLTQDVVLLLDGHHRLDRDAEAAVVEAAAPLLDALRRLGVIAPDRPGIDSETETDEAQQRSKELA